MSVFIYRFSGLLVCLVFCLNTAKSEISGSALAIAVHIPFKETERSQYFQHIIKSRKSLVYPALRSTHIKARDESIPVSTVFSGQTILLRKDTLQKERRVYKKHSFEPIKPLPLFFLGFGEVAGTHVASLIVLFCAPKEYTKWDYGFGRELLDHADEKFRLAWTTPPTRDKDNFNTNWIAHPYVGGYYYNFVRSKGATPLGSFLFGTFASTAWEFGVEAMFEHPSIQDLWITPVVGAVVGEASHQITLLLVKNKFTFGEKLLVLLINPPYFFNHGFKVPTEQRRKQLREWNPNKKRTEPVKEELMTEKELIPEKTTD